VILLDQLAVDHSALGEGIGAALLIDALSRCPTITDKIGVHAVEVDAVDEQAAAFFTRFGSSPLPNSALHLFLYTVTTRDSFSGGRG
jgi:GNAT superfamily N-acetyltransferase